MSGEGRQDNTELRAFGSVRRVPTGVFSNCAAAGTDPPEPRPSGDEPQAPDRQSSLPTQIETLWPPKPSEFERAFRTTSSRAAPGT